MYTQFLQHLYNIITEAEAICVLQRTLQRITMALRVRDYMQILILDEIKRLQRAV